MPAQKEDYFLQLFEMMGEMARRITKLRTEGHLKEALALVIAAQEKLFDRPATDFTSLDVAEQLRLLSLNESVENARAKRLLYASTLREAGLVYKARSNDIFAASAFQLALYVTLTVAVEANAAVDDLKPQIAELMGFVSADQLYPPTVELLEKLNS